MSRIAKRPIFIPSDIEILLTDTTLSIKGSLGQLMYIINKSVIIENNNSCLFFKANSNFLDGWSQAGTARALVYSMLIGVTKGFIKKLQLFGVGYRVTMIGNNIINMSLGYSHIIKYILPTGIVAELPSQTEIILKGINKQLVGQVAANLRSYRVPEPYKGKGIRYENEIIRVKEAKKK
ncbi:MAG TPA: 50S ribosomal protein L6 [Buchnera sp. (in: enterobacteria)]|nr:50S ribosomal protein L6 [Buchnera sp. (in: enterobacteria)]